MAIRTDSVTVTTSATRLSIGAENDGQMGRTVTVKNTGAVEVRLGGSDVTAAAGFPLGAGESALVDNLDVLEILFGVTASGSSTVAVFQTGV